MKNDEHNEIIRKSLEDIRSGRVFDVPPGYFEQLDTRLFDEHKRFRSKKTIPSLTHKLTYLPVAASVVLIIAVAWWFTRDPVSPETTPVTSTELQDYLEDEILEFDIEILAGSIPDDDFNSQASVELDNIHTYILEHIDEFETILYEH